MSENSTSDQIRNTKRDFNNENYKFYKLKKSTVKDDYTICRYEKEKFLQNKLFSPRPSIC